MANFLDKTGLSYFWSKVKNYVDNKVSESGASSVKAVLITLSASAWDENFEQTVSVPGILADESKQLIQPVAMVNSKDVYADSGVSCISQAENSLTFSCSNMPTSDLSVYIVVTEVILA